MFRYSNYPTLIEDIRHTLMERWRFLRKAGIQPEALTATPRALLDLATAEKDALDTVAPQEEANLQLANSLMDQYVEAVALLFSMDNF